jgi:hypothetical protein
VRFPRNLFLLFSFTLSVFFSSIHKRRHIVFTNTLFILIWLISICFIGRLLEVIILSSSWLLCSSRSFVLLELCWKIVTRISLPCSYMEEVFLIISAFVSVMSLTFLSLSSTIRNYFHGQNTRSCDLLSSANITRLRKGCIRFLCRKYFFS